MSLTWGDGVKQYALTNIRTGQVFRVRRCTAGWVCSANTLLAKRSALRWLLRLDDGN
jgi:hypothetical protein